MPEALLPPQVSETQRVDVRVGDARGALALGRALLNVPLAPPLPEPLPEAPAVPISYLSDLQARVDQRDLPPEAQWRLLTELEQHLTEPSERTASLTLLQRFAARPDLMQSVATAAQRVLDGFAGTPVPPQPGEAPPKEPEASRHRRRWLAAGAVVVVALGAVAVVLIVRSDDDSGSLAQFCDRSRSADSVGDQSAAVIFTPEVTPEAIERAYTDVLAQLRRVEASAPDDIADTTAAVVNGYEDEARLLENNGWVLAGVGQQLLTVSADPQAVRESQRFQTYLEEQCGVDWNAPSGLVDVSTSAQRLAVAYTLVQFDIGLTTEEARCMGAQLGDQIDGDRLLAIYGSAGVQITAG